NRSSADPIAQRQSSDCGQKQALGEGLRSQGIDAKPVTEDRIMHQREPAAMPRFGIAASVSWFKRSERSCQFLPRPVWSLAWAQ
ncbi:hypothetical protein EHS39_37285, partial [Ensifer sp. MPMI2T]